MYEYKVLLSPNKWMLEDDLNELASYGWRVVGFSGTSVVLERAKTGGWVR